MLLNSNSVLNSNIRLYGESLRHTYLSTYSIHCHIHGNILSIINCKLHTTFPCEIKHFKKDKKVWIFSKLSLKTFALLSELTSKISIKINFILNTASYRFWTLIDCWGCIIHLNVINEGLARNQLTCFTRNLKSASYYFLFDWLKRSLLQH